MLQLIAIVLTAILLTWYFWPVVYVITFSSEKKEEYQKLDQCLKEGLCPAPQVKPGAGPAR